MDKDYLNFEVDALTLEFIDEEEKKKLKCFFEDSQFAIAKVRAFSSGWNSYNMYCSEEVLKKTAETIYYKPLIYILDRFRDDFGSHADSEDSRPAGFVVPDSAKFIRLEDGRLSLEVLVKIWKYYAPTVMKIFSRDNGRKKVSVEMELLDYKNLENNAREMLNFSYSAITILGNIVQEGSPGANIEILSFAEEIANFENDLLLEFSSRYDSVNFEIPQNVKNNCKRGLSLYSQHGRADSRSLGNARYLIKNKNIEPKKVKTIYSIFNRSDKFQDMRSDPPSSDYIVYLLNGGRVGSEWINSIYQQMIDLDQKSLSYFEKITFPYKKREDANPSLRNWDPPLTLNQMNEIARQADAIERGGRPRSSAWAIAISNFKKTHRIKDGRWVKKEKMNAFLQDDISKEKEVLMEEEKKNVELEQEDVGKVSEETEEEVKEEAKEEKSEIESEESKDKDDQPHMESDKKDDLDEKMAQEKKFSIDIDTVLSIFSQVDGIEEELANEPIDLTRIIEKIGVQFSELKVQNQSLLEFKLEIERAEFKREIDITLSGLMEKFEIPDEKLEEMRKGSENFSLENIEQWKNQIKAKALDEFPIKKNDAGKKDEIRKYALPWSKKDDQRQNSVWDKYKK